MLKLITAAALAAALFLGVFPTSAQQPVDCWVEKESDTTETIEIDGVEFTDALTEFELDFNPACHNTYDGRVNPADQAAEAAIYCADTGVAIYDINLSAEGDLALFVPYADVDTVPNPPAENTLIAGGPGFALYRLTSGELQLNGPSDWQGKQYVFIWDGCPREE